MIAGYGDKRNVYDAEEETLVPGPLFVSRGAINSNEKTRLSSFGITIRVDKPITRNLSVKTGFQFLQTSQRVIYSQEVVSQFAIVNSLSTNNDYNTLYTN